MATNCKRLAFGLTSAILTLGVAGCNTTTSNSRNESEAISESPLSGPACDVEINVAGYSGVALVHRVDNGPCNDQLTAVVKEAYASADEASSQLDGHFSITVNGTDYLCELLGEEAGDCDPGYQWSFVTEAGSVATLPGGSGL